MTLADLDDGIPFWADTGRLPLTPFTEADYLAHRLPLEERRRGVHIKHFVKDSAGCAWTLKSGALGEERNAGHTDAIENARRLAFPLHEALIPLLFRRCGILVNKVCLGFRTMSVAITDERIWLPVSMHQMQAATSRHELQDFVPSADFVEDFLVMACLNVVVGQRDHLSHNYMVTDVGRRLLPVDNGDCMRYDWLVQERQPGDFVLTLPDGAMEPVSDSLRMRVKERLRCLTPEAIDTAFAALPQPCIELHDQNVVPGTYIAGTIAEKQARAKRNLEVLRRWAE